MVRKTVMILLGILILLGLFIALVTSSFRK